MRFKKKDLPDLRSEIKRLADEGRSFHPRIRAASGLERHALRNEKWDLGQEARHLLLAYAFLRGVPYRVLEPRCREDRGGREYLVLGAYRAVERWIPRPCQEEVEKERVEAWFDAPLAGEEAA